jgi:hypothetical protein
MSGRIRYIDQAHHLLSLFRQQSEEERRVTLTEMAEIIERRFSSAQMGGEELKAATTLRQMLPQHLGRLEPPSAWELAHLAVDWGHLDLSSDLRRQFHRQHTAKATEAAAKKTGDLLDFARADIRRHPKTAQMECARRVMKLANLSDEKHVYDQLAGLFVGQGPGKRKRPRADIFD